MTKQGKKLLVIGWDAADWGIIDDLMAKGRMPHLQRLIGRGVRCNLKTLEPRLSPLLWSTIATGKGADQHGILNFVEPKPDGQGLRLVQSTTRRTKALWNMFSQSGLRTHVVGWYASHPAEPIRGVIVSNSLPEESEADFDPDIIHPQNIALDFKNLVRSKPVLGSEQISTWLPRYREVAPQDDHFLKGLIQKMTHAHHIAQISEWLLTNDPWDVSMVFFDTIDTMGHEFMAFRQPKLPYVSDKHFRLFSGVMDAVYEWHDQVLGRMLAHTNENTNVVILSDHGFQHGPGRPATQQLSPDKRMEMEASWHRTFGIWASAGPQFRQMNDQLSMSLMDVAPTLLAICGLPAGQDMPGRVIEDWLMPKSFPGRIQSWDLPAQNDGVHPPNRISNPLEQVATLKQLIDLGYLAALPDDVAQQIDLVERESRYNLAGYLTFAREYERAASEYELLWMKHPTTARYATGWVQNLLSAKQYVRAQSAVQDLLHQHPTLVEGYLLQSNAFLSNGMRTEAEHSVEQAARLNGQNREHYANVANAWLNIGKIDKALQYTRQLLNLSGGEPKIDILVAKIFLAAGQIERAAEKALDALDISQAIPEAHFVLGACLAWMQQPADAMLCLDLALKLQPDHVEAQRFTKMLKGEEIDDEFDSILDRCNALIPYGSIAFKEKYHKR